MRVIGMPGPWTRKRGGDMKVVLALALFVASAASMAHSGGTDSNGCHYNHRTGVYHCH